MPQDSGCHEHDEADYRVRINPNQANVSLRLVAGGARPPPPPASTQDLGGALVRLWMAINGAEAHQKDAMANVRNTQSQWRSNEILGIFCFSFRIRV